MEDEFGAQEEEYRGVIVEVKKVMCICEADIVMWDMSMLCIEEDEVAIGMAVEVMEAMFMPVIDSMMLVAGAIFEVGQAGVDLVLSLHPRCRLLECS